MKRAPMARGGEVEEIVGPVVFLCSPMASYVNGVVLPVDGGFLSA
jgi:NAD(P)-dependent dehydrogenase (short-subunit alcohol dehydrogenase family)